MRRVLCAILCLVSLVAWAPPLEDPPPPSPPASSESEPRTLLLEALQHFGAGMRTYTKQLEMLKPLPARLDALETSLLELSTDLETQAESSKQEYDLLRSTIDEYTETSRTEREALAREVRRVRLLCWVLGVVAAISAGLAAWLAVR